MNPNTLVVVDRRIAADDLAAGAVPADALWVWVDDDQDGLTQLAAALSGLRGIQAIHIVSHGRPGALWLGTGWIDTEALQASPVDWASMASALAPGADLMLYGCDVAAGSAGEVFVETLARLTRADVAASIDATGAEALGANLALERTVGDVQSTVLPMTTSNLVLGSFIGGAGDDHLDGTVDADLMMGNGGDDWLSGYEGDDTLIGGLGADWLVGGIGVDQFIYLSGSELAGDYISDFSLGDVLDLSALAPLSVVYGQLPANAVATEAQPILQIERVDGSYTSVTLHTGWWSSYTLELFDAPALREKVPGSLQFEEIPGLLKIGTESDEALIGSAYDDTLMGFGGDDALFGLAGSDLLQGDFGNDFISGAGGRDTLYGGEGDDTLEGGAGWDVLYGGAGNDVFVYREVLDFSQGDYIADFSVGDTLDLSAFENLRNFYGQDLPEAARVKGVVASFMQPEAGYRGFPDALQRPSRVPG